MKVNRNYYVGKPQVLEPEIEEVIKVVKSGWWVSGPQVKEFAEDFKNYIGTRYAVPVDSGTAALHLSLIALEIKPEDEVITTPFTFPATAHAIEYMGAKPVFVDVDKDTFNIDVKKIEAAITPKTKAIIPVHVAGLSCEIDTILDIAKRHKLKVVWDACHAIETQYKGKKVGRYPDMSCFSFDVTKNVAGGMGGMVTTDDSHLAEVITKKSHFGMLPTEFYLPYDADVLGYKYDMTEFCAAIAKHQLKRAEKNLLIRKKLWYRYNQAFSNNILLSIPKEMEDSVHARHLYMLILSLEKMKVGREVFLKELGELGVKTRIRFTPLHLLGYYRQKYNFSRGNFPVCEDISDRVFCLPLSPILKDQDITYIISAVNKVSKKFAK